METNRCLAGDDTLGELADASLMVQCGPLIRRNIISDPYNMDMFTHDNFITVDGMSAPIEGRGKGNFARVGMFELMGKLFISNFWKSWLSILALSWRSLCLVKSLLSLINRVPSSTSSYLCKVEEEKQHPHRPTKVRVRQQFDD